MGIPRWVRDPRTHLGLLLLSTMTLRRGYNWVRVFRSHSVKEPASRGSWLICRLGVLSETGIILPPPLQRGVARRERNKGGANSPNLGSPRKRPEGQLFQDSAPCCPYPPPCMRWPPGASVPTCSPEGGKTCLPAQGPSAPLDPRLAMMKWQHGQRLAEMVSRL